MKLKKEENAMTDNVVGASPYVHEEAEPNINMNNLVNSPLIFAEQYN